MTITLAEPRGFMTYARRISPVHQGCCVYTCMYVFDDVNSVLSWPNNFLDVYVMMQKKNEINVWLAGQSLLIPYALK